MKSYWIAAAVLVMTVWPGSKAYSVGTQQTMTEGSPVQKAQTTSPSANKDKPVIAPATAAKPDVADAPAASPDARAETAKPKSSYMLVELTKPLKAKKLKVGDKVRAEVSQDVVAHGKVIIPVETKLLGHVTEVNARDSGQPESRLGIVFDRILLKHHEINFEAVVQAVAPPVIRKSLVDSPSQMLPPSMMGVGSRGAVPTGRNNGASTNGASQSGSGGSASLSAITTQAPVTVKESASPHVANSGGVPETVPNGKPMSVGMPQGITGLKGLSLSSVPSPRTPGPVIVSNTENVSLDSGTQILLHILKVEVPANEKPAK